MEARSSWPQHEGSVTIVNDLSEKGIHFKVLTGQGAEIDTTTAAGRMIFGIFASLAEYERELIRESIQAGLKAALPKFMKRLVGDKDPL